MEDSIHKYIISTKSTSTFSDLTDRVQVQNNKKLNDEKERGRGFNSLKSFYLFVPLIKELIKICKLTSVNGIISVDRPKARSTISTTTNGAPSTPDPAANNLGPYS